MSNELTARKSDIMVIKYLGAKLRARKMTGISKAKKHANRSTDWAMLNVWLEDAGIPPVKIGHYAHGIKALTLLWEKYRLEPQHE